MADPAPTDAQHSAIANAMWTLLRPLTRLAVARGVPFAMAEEMLKRAFVDAARDAQADPGAQRIVSRISAATGISRREVTRLLENAPRAAVRPRSPAAEVFAHWTTARAFRDRRGAPRVLPRQGREPSFETLAQSVTRDVHPRSLLEELVRLGLAEHDARRDTVRLLRATFVPSHDEVRLLGFLADNVGDHLSAAVHNVLAGDGPRHFEQAVFAEELSADAVIQAREAVRKQWQLLIHTMVPMLERSIEHDTAQRRERSQRLRVGLFTYSEGAAPGGAGGPRRGASKESG